MFKLRTRMACPDPNEEWTMEYIMSMEHDEFAQAITKLADALFRDIDKEKGKPNG